MREDPRTYSEGLRLVVSFDACFGLAEKDLLEQGEAINSEMDGGVFEVHLNLIQFRFLS